MPAKTIVANLPRSIFLFLFLYMTSFMTPRTMLQTDCREEITQLFVNM
jgi:hypothetical protein